MLPFFASVPRVAARGLTADVAAEMFADSQLLHITGAFDDGDDASSVSFGLRELSALHAAAPALVERSWCIENRGDAPSPAPCGHDGRGVAKEHVLTPSRVFAYDDVNAKHTNAAARQGATAAAAAQRRSRQRPRSTDAGEREEREDKAGGGGGANLPSSFYTSFVLQHDEALSDRTLPGCRSRRRPVFCRPSIRR